MKPKKILTAALLSLALGAGANANELMAPSIGTAGSLAITVPKEKQYGEFFMRTVRSQSGVINDPVLNEYLNFIGNRLVSNASNVQFPFEFFLVNDSALNAAAFLGGKIQVNTGLFNYSDSEDQFASVLAHEVVHVTQRHIARIVEAQAGRTSVTLAGAIGSIAMAIINPMVGMAALSTTVGLAAQTNINFTRENEYEADRLSIAIMHRAGFNPEGTVEMFKKLYSMQGNINPAQALLSTHPLSEQRIAEAQSRILSYPKRKSSANPNFQLAKARVAVRFGDKSRMADFKEGLVKNYQKHNETYRNYALALLALDKDDTAEARSYLSRLGPELQGNIFVVDVKTDIDITDKNYSAAIGRLVPMYKRMPRNHAVVINLANTYIQAGQYGKAREVLDAYMKKTSRQYLALTLMAEALEKLNNRCEALQVQGEILEMAGNYNRAIGRFNQALQTCEGYLDKERIKARVVQATEQRSFDESLKKTR